MLSNISKGARDIWRATKFSGFRARAVGAAFSQMEVLVEFTVSFYWRADRRHRHIWVSIRVAKTDSPPQRFPEILPHPTAGQLKSLSQFFYTNGLSWLILQTILKSLKGSQNQNKQHLSPAHSLPLAEWPPKPNTSNSQAWFMLGLSGHLQAQYL